MEREKYRLQPAKGVNSELLFAWWGTNTTCRSATLYFRPKHDSDQPCHCRVLTGMFVFGKIGTGTKPR